MKRMASGSSLSSKLLFRMRNEADHVYELTGVQQDTRVMPPTQPQPHIVPPKKRKNPSRIQYSDPDAEVIALSPTTLMATNRFVCEVCNKGFPREQNLQLHKRGHNLPWKLKQRIDKDAVKRKVYVCPEPSCINHNPSHALGDLTGIKKHYSRKHGEKQYKCQKCSKVYAVRSDLKAHSKNCGTKEYKCDCGTLFSRRDSFITHKALCKALAQGGVITQPLTLNSMGINSFKSTSNNNDNDKVSVIFPQLGSQTPSIQNLTHTQPAIAPVVSQLGHFGTTHSSLMIRPSMDFCYKPSYAFFTPPSDQQNQNNLVNNTTSHNNIELYNLNLLVNHDNYGSGEGSSSFSGGSIMSDTGAMPQLSPTVLLQKAALLGSMSRNNSATNLFVRGVGSSSFSSAGGAMKPEKGKLLFSGSGHFGISDSSGHDSNMNHELLNSFNSGGAGSSIFNHAGASYEQEDSYRGVLDNGSRGYIDERKSINFEKQQRPEITGTNMGFQRSNSVTLTRDFLGVGGEIVDNISSDEQEGTFGGGSFL